MTSISSATSYASYYPTTTTTTAKTTTSTSSSTTSTSSSSATNKTLSDAALAAMNTPDFATVVTQTRAALDALVADGTKPADADLSKLDRRQLFAVATNAQGKFTPDEMAAAQTEQQNRLDQALAGPLAVAHVTDDIEGIYTAAQTFLDGASDEEKATATWQNQKAALTTAQQDLAADPSTTPQVDGDIVADYIQRADAGQTGATRSFSDVATDARAALDAQYADAKANGKDLSFSTKEKGGQLVDFSQFDSRSLSAIALNQDGKFSSVEASAAKAEINKRSSATVLAGLNAASSSDPGAFAKNLLSAYASMSPEERQAAGWSDQLYAAAVSSYNSATKMANMFGSASSSGSSSALSLLNGGDSSSSSSDPALSLLGGGTSSTDSLADILNQQDASSSSGSSSDGSMSLADFLSQSGS